MWKASWLSSFCYDCSLPHHPCKNFHGLIKWHHLWINKPRPLASIHYRFFALLSCDTLCFKLLILYNLITFWGEFTKNELCPLIALFFTWYLHCWSTQFTKRINANQVQRWTKTKKRQKKKTLQYLTQNSPQSLWYCTSKSKTSKSKLSLIG